MGILEEIRKKRLIFDGGMGSLLQARGPKKPGELPGLEPARPGPSAKFRGIFGSRLRHHHDKIAGANRFKIQKAKTG